MRTCSWSKESDQSSLNVKPTDGFQMINKNTSEMHLHDACPPASFPLFCSWSPEDWTGGDHQARGQETSCASKWTDRPSAEDSAGSPRPQFDEAQLVATDHHRLRDRPKGVSFGVRSIDTNANLQNHDNFAKRTIVS